MRGDVNHGYEMNSAVDLDARVRAHEALSFREEKFPNDALRLLAEEVLSRLASRFVEVPQAENDAPSDESIDALADALISKDDNEGLNFVMALQKQKVDRDTIYLGYLAGAARCLGERWVADTLSFTDVTLGVGRLYVILRALRSIFAPEMICRDTGKIALFCSAPGEDHVLGVTMAADMFRERGWTIDLQTAVSHENLIQIACSRHFPIIGISASTRRMIVPLTRLIASLRVVSPASYIVVSGELTLQEDDLAKIVDADFVAHNASEAIEELHRIADKLEVS